MRDLPKERAGLRDADPLSQPGHPREVAAIALHDRDLAGDAGPSLPWLEEEQSVRIGYRARATCNAVAGQRARESAARALGYSEPSRDFSEPESDADDY